VTFVAGIGDALGATAVILCIPLAILAIGIPIVLAVRVVLWAVGAL
jgi:hypothetical protein